MSRSAPTTVVFDLGGVLVDWDPRYLYRSLLADDDAVESFLAEVTTPEWNAAQDAGRSWDDAVAALTAQHPNHAELIAAYHHRWTETIGGQIDGTVDLLRELRDTGVGLYALTNWSDEKFPHAEERFDWLSWFEGIVVSGREGLVKPDARIFRVLLDRYGLDPSVSVFIDDNPANVEAARELGFTALRFTGSQQLAGSLAELGLVPNRKEATA
ncbi:2-haloacid dehalogenase [Haloactinopolyspora alba]|uniref:2-haloacid dehalogenase n=1 Tax=Haloactinopolyspora alba TaxID=648780 RepID=A0A2P8E3H4_9ACTN|nr:HAD family phosphatase [Haloactinopolyspora alba]PSL04023.1 2-haloacid dehalogenase [Haloactinopolyspora alba]